MPTLIEIGRVAELHRYPVKSMRGQTVNSIDVGWTGFDGDRQYAFFKPQDKSRFPWLTGRDYAEMLLFTAHYVDERDTRTSRVSVTAPDGMVHDVASETLLAMLQTAYEDEVSLLQLGRGAFDLMPVSIIGQGTIDAVGAQSGRDVGCVRFRPNIVIDTGIEREWLDGCLIFGDAASGVRLRANKPIGRCSMITIDPATGTREPEVMRTVVERFQNEIGIYCVPERLGALSVGDKVWLER